MLSFVPFVMLGLLSLSAIEDVEYLSAPRLYLYLALSLGAAYSVQQGQYMSTAFVVFALLWTYKVLPGYTLLLVAVYPITWPLIVLGAGVREGRIGEGDLLTVASAFLISPLAGWGGFVGLLLWEILKKRRGLWVPAIPGILMGALPFLVRW